MSCSTVRMPCLVLFVVSPCGWVSVRLSCVVQFLPRMCPAMKVLARSDVVRCSFCHACAKGVKEMTKIEVQNWP